MNNKYEAPTTTKDAFNCPFCHAFAQQLWFKPDGMVSTYHGKEVSDLMRIAGKLNDGIQSPTLTKSKDPLSTAEVTGMVLSRCGRCERLAIWVGDKMIFPDTGTAEEPSDDMPEKVKTVYNEASSIHSKSPRAAAALLRLAIQLLLVHLGESGKNINDDIKSLVKKGLDTRLQKAFDTLRLVGNDSVHPGEINVNDNPQISQGLFKLINIIVEKMISEPKAIDDLYDFLPNSKKDSVARRDNKQQP